MNLETWCSYKRHTNHTRTHTFERLRSKKVTMIVLIGQSVVVSCHHGFPYKEKLRFTTAESCLTREHSRTENSRRRTEASNATFFAVRVIIHSIKLNSTYDATYSCALLVARDKTLHAWIIIVFKPNTFISTWATLIVELPKVALGALQTGTKLRNMMRRQFTWRKIKGD